MKTGDPNNNRRLRGITFLTLLGLYGNLFTAAIAILKLVGVLEISALEVIIYFGVFGGLSYFAKLLIKQEANRRF